jgi:hypothetical protein
MRAEEQRNQSIIRILLEKGANTIPQDEVTSATPQEQGATPESPNFQPRQARKCFSCLSNIYLLLRGIMFRTHQPDLELHSI